MEEDLEKEPIKEQKGSYISGTIGALIGGIIASIPWILTYSFGNMIVAILSTLIAGGAFWGYKIFRGKVGKPFPIVIALVSIIVIILTTLVVSPIILLYKEGFEINIYNFKMLYSINEMRTAIIHDLVLSLIFTALGIAAVIKSIRIQIKNGITNNNIKFNSNAIEEELIKNLQEISQVVKKVCISLNCTNKESTATKQEILNELEMTHNLEIKKAKAYFRTISSMNILRKHKGKYYYDETVEKKKLEKGFNEKSNKKVSKIFTIIMIILMVIGIVASIIADPNTTYEIPGTDVQLTITQEQILYSTEEELVQYFGEETAKYYSFVILDKKEKEYEICGTLVSKEEIGEEYNINSMVESDRTYIVANLGEEKVTEISDIKLNERDVKTYNYKYTTEEKEYISIIYLFETQDKYFWIDFYADGNFEIEKANEIMSEILK